MQIRHKLFTALFLRRELIYKKIKETVFQHSLNISTCYIIVADTLDYLVAPIFGVPIIGDIFDVIIAGLLYFITRNKVAIMMNLTEYIPFFGDFLPVYTVSTALWILREQEDDKLIFIKSY